MFNPHKNRCLRCKSIDVEDGQKWCASCRANKREENARNKKNRELRDDIANRVGFSREQNRTKNKEIKQSAMNLFGIKKETDD